MAVVVIALAAVQPLCTRGNFQAAMGPLLDDGQRLVAESVFSDYLDRAGALDDEDGHRAAAMLDDFIASLQALAADPTWTQACQSLHTTVLLEERESNNPWPGCPWIDPALLDPPAEVSSPMYTFLTEEAHRDRLARAAQRSASAAGDLDACRLQTAAAMERWSTWQDLLDHLMQSVTPPLTGMQQLAYRTVAYPGLVLDPQPPRATQWIMEHVEDPDVHRTAAIALSRWQTSLAHHHEQEIADIRTARVQYGFDPWSPGCGTPTSSAAITLRNNLLARSAKASLLAHEVMSRLESLLSKKDRTALREYLDQVQE